MNNKASKSSFYMKVLRLNLILLGLAILALPSSFLLLLVLTQILTVSTVKWLTLLICVFWLVIFLGLIARLIFIKNKLSKYEAVKALTSSPSALSSISSLVLIATAKYFFQKKFGKSN